MIESAWRSVSDEGERGSAQPFHKVLGCYSLFLPSRVVLLMHCKQPDIKDKEQKIEKTKQDKGKNRYLIPYV